MSEQLQLTMRLYVIRQESTGFYFPDAKNGFSHLEPCATTRPRLFYSRTAAISALAQWRRGAMSEGCRSRDPFGVGWEQGELKIEVKPHRLKDDYMVHELTAVLPE